MTTTEFLENRPLYYNTLEECIINSKKMQLTSNPKYPFFKQGVFHAGDKEQFELFRDKSNGSICVTEINMKNNIFYNKNINDYSFYNNLNSDSVDNTFNYIFYKFKKGIFLKIKDGKVVVFLPFSNVKFINEWSDKIQIDPKYSNLIDFFRNIYISNNDSRFDPKYINKNIKNWYANNCLLRSEFPINEKDTSVSQLKDMFVTLCSEREVPDIELFINKRDFPLLKKNLTEPYEDIFGENIPLISHNHKNNYSPILSHSITEDFADLPLPTAKDWERVNPDKYFFGQCSNIFNEFNISWELKIPIAVFRGSSTGCGVTIDSNIRLKLSYMSSLKKLDVDNLPYLDAGITKWNYRPKKLKGEKYLKFLESTKLPFSLVPYMSIYDQSKYKYIINVDGNVSAYRLSDELNTGSVILLVKSKYRLWFTPLLKPYIHYVPVKEDLSDIYIQISWCKNNDNKCREIANNAKEFYKKYLQRDGIFDYLQSLLYKLKNNMGVYLYTYITPSEIQFKDEMLSFSKKFPDNDYKLQSLSDIPVQERSFSLLQGINWVINYILSKQINIPYYFPRKSIIYSTKVSTIFLHSFMDKDIIVFKDNVNVLKNKHELFIGQKAVNNILKSIPNFAYTYGYVTSSNNECILLQERLVGLSLKDYILSSNFNIKTLIMILAQLSLVLQFSLNTCGFSHNNMISDNILLQFLQFNIINDYSIDLGIVYSVNTNIIPYIIDYGKSSMIYNFIHHSYDDIFSLKVGKDISTLVKNCLSLVLNRSMNKQELYYVFKISEYFKSFNKVNDIKYFLTGDDIVNKEPIYFFYHLQKILDMNNINKKTSVIYTMNNGNSKQVFDYCFSPTIEKKIESFTNLFKNFKMCSIPQPTDKLNIYYVAQNFYNNLISTYNLFIKFIERNDLDIKYADSSVVKYLDFVYKNKLTNTKPTSFEFIVDKSYNSFIPTPYTENDFNLPNKIFELLKLTGNLENIFEKNAMLKTIYNYGGNKFTMSKDDKIFYSQEYVKVPVINLLNNKANIDTIKYYSKIVFKKDKKILSKNINDTIILNCKDKMFYAKNYLKNYEKIIKIEI